MSKIIYVFNNKIKKYILILANKRFYLVNYNIIFENITRLFLKMFNKI